MMLKLGQIAGVLMMSGGVAAYLMGGGQGRAFAQLLLWGAVLYGVCSLTAWLRAK
jgi:hypothetical protein